MTPFVPASVIGGGDLRRLGGGPHGAPQNVLTDCCGDSSGGSCASTSRGLADCLGAWLGVV